MKLKEKMKKYRGIFPQLFTEKDKDYIKRVEDSIISDLRRILKAIRYEDHKLIMEQDTKKNITRYIIEIKNR